jgi:hypothetical protein
MRVGVGTKPRGDSGYYNRKDQMGNKNKGQGIDYFCASGWCGDYHGVHIHALMGNCYGIRRLTVMDKWYERYGIARIYAYNK